MTTVSARFIRWWTPAPLLSLIHIFKKAEDREMFKETMEKIGEPVAPSDIVEDVKHGLEIAEKIGYPVVLRPAYTLGGSGGGIAANPEQCAEILENGLRLSRVGQVLVERCIAGWKEIEYEVMRDGAGNVITVCNMENIDPVGVHTGAVSYTHLKHSQMSTLFGQKKRNTTEADPRLKQSMN